MKCSTKSLDIAVCNTFTLRLFGISRMHSISPRDAVWLTPCRRVHTFGMRQSLSLIFLDRDRNIVGREICAKPWRIYGRRDAYSVIEMAQKTEEDLQAIELEIAWLGQMLARVKHHHESRIETRVQDTAKHNV